MKSALISNFTFMNNTLVDQFQFEIDAWKRSIEFIEIENNYLLTRLGLLLKDSSQLKVLNGAEMYQEKLVEMYKVLKYCKKDLETFDDLILLDKYECLLKSGKTINGKHLELVYDKYHHLKEEICTIELKFKKLQNDFNTYISCVL